MKRGLLTALLMVFFIGTFAQPGVLDQTFGVGGKVIIPADSTATTKAVVIQSDGKIISGTSTTINNIQYLTLIRYHTDGSFDTTFGINGRINVHPGSFCSLGDIALQPDGKIIVGGNVSDTTTNNRGGFLLIRYLPNGTLDSTFGNNGMVKTYPQTYYSLSLTCIIIKPDGKIVAGGSISSIAFTEDPFVEQYLPNGQPDNSFNSNAFYISLPYGNAKSVSNMVATADGKIIASIEAKMVPANNSSDFLIAKLLANGSNDSSFGKNGINYTDFNNSGDMSYGITMLPDSSLVLSGSYMQSGFYHFALVKYTPNGKVDSSFGTNGRVTTRLSGKSSAVNKIITDPSGKLIVCGYAYSGLWSDNAYDFALAVYNSNGSLDSTFGRNGMLTTDFANGKDNANALSLQADGKIVLAGDSYNGHVTSIALARYERNQFLNYNSIDGFVFVDNNANGIKEANERYYNNAKVSTKHNADSVITFTFNGSFSVETDTGTFVSRAIAPLNYYNIVPASHTSTFTNYLNTDNVQFGLQPVPGKRDLALYIASETAARPGFPLRYRIFYKNQGTDTLVNGTIKLVKSPLCNYTSSSPMPANILGDTIWWNINNLKPMDTASIVLKLMIQPPPLTNLNDTIRTIAVITIDANEQTPLDNIVAVKQVLRNSYDPNDKTENHGGRITTQQIANGDYLQYTIRFQNTGNDTAFNIYIRDTLDYKLDWTTMQVLTSSHNYQMTMNDGNKCLFTFSNINLVDSIKNEPGSHGYIVYRIKPKSDVVLGDIIRNTAAIYFDYNLPVLTNTETTTVVSEVLPLRLLSFAARKDNKTNLLTWTTTNEINVAHFEIERSSNGREFRKIGTIKAGLSNYSFTDKSPLALINYYRLKMVDKDGKFEYSPIRMISNNNDGQISIYPNPARESVTVAHPATSAVAQLQLTDIAGRILRRTNVAVESVQTNINIKGLPAGKYFITWSNALVSHTQALVIE